MEGSAPENEPEKAKLGISLVLGRLSAAEVMLITGPAELCPLGQSRKTGRERKPLIFHSPPERLGDPGGGGRPRGTCASHQRAGHTGGCSSLGLPAALAQRCLRSINTAENTRAPILGTAGARGLTQDPDGQGLCCHLPVGTEATAAAWHPPLSLKSYTLGLGWRMDRTCA